MPKLLTSATAALILLAGAATAHAQQAPSIATLPPQAPQGATASEASGAVAPLPKYVGPAPGAPESATFGASANLAGTPSAKYLGPAPGGPEGANYGASEKPAGYESSAAMRPYTTTGMGPKAN